jgi:hypothetical protein
MATEDESATPESWPARPESRAGPRRRDAGLQRSMHGDQVAAPHELVKFQQVDVTGLRRRWAMDNHQEMIGVGMHPRRAFVPGNA